DEVSVTGTAEEYYEMTEIGNVTEVVVLSSDNNLPAATVVTTAEANDEQYESVLLSITEATCTNPDIGFGEFELDDGSGPLAIDDLFYEFAAQQDVVYSVTGPQMYAFGAYKVMPREAGDVSNASPLYYVSMPEEFDITTTGMTIQWETNDDANSVVEWGLTTAYEFPTQTDETLTTSHSIQLTDMQPSEVYYIRVHSTDGENSTTMVERVVCAQSESSGAIEVYFNHPVDTDVATTSEATYDPDITATIISYIAGAQATLDITMYDTFGCPQSIFDAINAAYANGVAVRFITDEEPENVELDWLDPAISVAEGNFVGIMHNKFLVIDGEDTDNCWVMTGSMNWTDANLGWDFNNVICIQDESLAKAYTIEFEEMWGGQLSTPNFLLAAYGEFKTDNTPHKFVIGGKDVELYFSPSDGTADQMIDVIGATENEMAFAIMAFTENSLGNAVLAAHNDG
ncbi:MAG: hypothetical protein HKN32_08860, partial [Flavobacteriales bacterium]|nr:hypothetical protein [Flavobacteriales bacterium]